MNDHNPLMQSTTSVTPSTVIRRYENGDPLETLAREWSCASCACVLGVVHLSFGVTLTLIDMITTTVSNTPFAISAAIVYIITAILCFIATGRVDRCTQFMLVIFSLAGLAISCAIFVDSAIVLNSTCTPTNYDENELVVHSMMVIICLTELLTCFCTMLVCFRSLRGAVAVSKAYSPYSTLIVGDYSTLKRPERILRPKFAYLPRRAAQLLQ
ncbi:unnamed protein product [Cylicocyclus nassatus]|uniref:Uncharacterized protein n=1 Tax=Cylicocyclus nassatus TaxID=53992 RepID=A0AA36MCN5_CYLNA|nr:unnamed protein product [Cylicocyclus nassatus]